MMIMRMMIMMISMVMQKKSSHNSMTTDKSVKIFVLLIWIILAF